MASIAYATSTVSSMAQAMLLISNGASIKRIALEYVLPSLEPVVETSLYNLNLMKYVRAPESEQCPGGKPGLLGRRTKWYAPDQSVVEPFHSIVVVRLWWLFSLIINPMYYLCWQISRLVARLVLLTPFISKIVHDRGSWQEAATLWFKMLVCLTLTPLVACAQTLVLATVGIVAPRKALLWFWYTQGLIDVLAMGQNLHFVRLGGLADA